MPSTIAIAHYCEGAGHATRMLAVARALEAAGAEVILAGGGAGARFVELNGYDAFEPTPVDYIDTYQGDSRFDVLTGSVPASARRISEYVDWLRREDPDALVTDDMFAALAVARVDVPAYVLKHDMPDVYADRVERLGARFHARFQRSVAREFFYPAVWPVDDVPSDVTPIPPVALDGPPSDDRDPDVVVVPSHYSDLDAVAERLADRGLAVLHVGGDGWDPVPALTPYIRRADVVVCSGYSTIMEAAVAGTPCIVRPVTDEQVGVARRLEGPDVTGFRVVADADEAVAAARSPPPAHAYENGAGILAERVLADLREHERATPPTTPTGTGTAGPRFGRRQVLRAAAGAAGIGLTGSAVAASTGRRSFWVRSMPDAHDVLDRADFDRWRSRTQGRYGAHGLPDLVAAETGTFDGAWVDANRFDGEGYGRISGIAVGASVLATFSLDPADGRDRYRHWFWSALDASDARAETGALGGRERPLVPTFLRSAHVPAGGRVEGYAPHETLFGEGKTVTLGDVSAVTHLSGGRLAGHPPGERGPKHESKRVPTEAITVSWIGGDDVARTASALGVWETSHPRESTTDWRDASWEFVHELRPVPR